MGGDDAPGVFTGAAAPTIADMWRGTVTSVQQLGSDVEVVVEPIQKTSDERQGPR
jgi:hypothetical protein